MSQIGDTFVLLASSSQRIWVVKILELTKRGFFLDQADLLKERNRQLTYSERRGMSKRFIGIAFADLRQLFTYFFSLMEEGSAWMRIQGADRRLARAAVIRNPNG